MCSAILFARAHKMFKMQERCKSAVIAVTGEIMGEFSSSFKFLKGDERVNFCFWNCGFFLTAQNLKLFGQK